MTTANKIVAENALPGTPQSVWDLTGPYTTNIEGFTTQISINHGDTVDFKINTDSKNYRIEIYRLGYYGGDGARLITTIQHQSSVSVLQPQPLSDPATGLVDAGNWQVTDSWQIPTDAVSGVFVAKLVREDGTFGESQIPFIVRDDGSHSDVVLQTSDPTWQAYNTWGGHYLYDGSTAVSYNRPINTRGNGFPWNYVFGEEYAAIRWLEANGYDVSYVAGVDTAKSGAQLLNHQIFVSVGHDEYWSAEQRANVAAARDAGVNLAFLTGNEVFWKTQWKPSIDGTNTDYRTLVTYKETQNNLTNPSGVWTGTWGDPNAPAGVSPQNQLTGTLYTVNGGDALGTIQVPYQFAQNRFWRNTSIASTLPGQTGSLVSGYLGPEWDEDVDNGFRPAGLIDLSSTTAAVTSHLSDFKNNTYTAGSATHSLTLYRASSGALVFSAGTIYWAWGLDSVHDAGPGFVTAPADRNVQQAMVNLFADMGVQPANLQPTLVPASRSTDTLAPVVDVSQLKVQSQGASDNIFLAGTAVDIGGGLVAGIELSLDNGISWHPATGAAQWTDSFNNFKSTTVWARAIDDSVNIGAPESVPNAALARAIDDAHSAGIGQAQSYSAQLNNQSAAVWDNYDSSGLWDEQTIAYADGTLAVAYFDTVNSQSATVWNEYDSTGVWDLQSITLADGSRSIAQLDPSNNDLWSQVVNDYNTAGYWTLQTVDYNDGTHTTAQLDPLSQQQWSLVVDGYDSAGDWLSQSIDYRNQTRSVAQLDYLNNQPWYSDNYVFDSSNNLTSHYQVLDDGTVKNIAVA